MPDDCKFRTGKQYEDGCSTTYVWEFPNKGRTRDDTGIPTMSDEWELPTDKQSEEDCWITTGWEFPMGKQPDKDGSITVDLASEFS